MGAVRRTSSFEVGIGACGTAFAIFKERVESCEERKTLVVEFSKDTLRVDPEADADRICHFIKEQVF